MDRNKLGIFGDSFADINPKDRIDIPAGRMPWPIALKMLLGKKTLYAGNAATSSWFSYKNFLNAYKTIDTAVFCYSNNHRWHNINPDSGIAPIYNIISPDQLSFVHPDFKSIAKKLVDVHPYLFDPQLDLFISQHIFNSVNDICREQNIKLVNILSFEEVQGEPLTIDISNNAGTVLTNLSDISGNEDKHFIANSKELELYKEDLFVFDKRFCHLNPHNNTVLSHIIRDCLENDVVYKNLVHDDRFSYDIEHLRYIIDEN